MEIVEYVVSKRYPRSAQLKARRLMVSFRRFEFGS